MTTQSVTLIRTSRTFFFFQAEDGIRDLTVTGVQTCALPIFGLDAELVGAEEVARLLPQASAEALYGAVWMPGDGYVDPHIATYAVAAAAREHGAEIRINTRVTGIELGPDRQIRAVLTNGGRIETGTVVNAAGMWAPQIAAMVGTFACSIPVDHQHIALHAVEGHELPRSTPCFRDTDNLVYGKAESGGVMFGGYEPNPVSRWHDGVPWEHGSKMLPADPARFKRLMALHERLAELGAVFGTKNGWERAEYFAPGEPSRRAGEEQRAFGWARPPWHDRVAVEHAAMRERLGIIDMTSFGKLETSDLDALERVCGARIDRPLGSVVYTQLLDERGRIVGDVTVTRLAAGCFPVGAGGGAGGIGRRVLGVHG